MNGASLSGLNYLDIDRFLFFVLPLHSRKNSAIDVDRDVFLWVEICKMQCQVTFEDKYPMPPTAPD